MRYTKWIKRVVENRMLTFHLLLLQILLFLHFLLSLDLLS